jgi:hypothetical protein
MKTTNNLSNVDEKPVSCRWTGGVQIDELDDLQSLIVQTRNSTYEITVLSGERGEILVRGGSFRDRTPIHLSGASLAGSLLKLRGIYAGLNMEFEYDGRYILSSPVQRVGIPSHLEDEQ